MTQLQEREHVEKAPEWRIRIATPSDARRIVEYLQNILKDRQASIADVDEMALDVLSEREHLRRMLDNPLATVFVAVDGKEIIGFLTCECGRRRKVRHTAEVGMSVHMEYRQIGIGTALLKTAEKWASATGRIRKLTLNVFETNQVALDLYAKNGFKVEGVLREHVKLDGKYLDLILMGKFLK